MTDILDLIDGALRDYGTSTDAMRWTPEPADDAIAAGNIVAHQLLTHAGPGIVTALPPPPSREPGRTMLDDGYCRIMCGGEVVYEGPSGWWP